MSRNEVALRWEGLAALCELPLMAAGLGVLAPAARRGTSLLLR